MTDEQIMQISEWAKTYYPSCTSPPPAGLDEWITVHDLVALFRRTQSKRAHLALVDQHVARVLIDRKDKTDPVLREAVSESWARGG
jgi:hypothetical protein